MANMSYGKITSRLIEEKNKGIRNLTLFLLSRFLRYSRFCYFFTLNLAGNKIQFSSLAIPTSLFVYGDLEPETTKFLQKNLKNGDVYIDIGANIGTTALVAAKTVGDNGIVVCFEPNKKTYKALIRNIKINNFNNVLAKQCALGEKDGTTMFLNGNNDDMNRVSDGSNGNVVHLATLDSYTQHIDHIRLIKIDVEGYEVKVLRGAIQTLIKTDMVFFESIEQNAQNYGFKVQDIIFFLKQHNFSIMDINLTLEYEGDENPLSFPSNLVAINLLKN